MITVCVNYCTCTVLDTMNALDWLDRDLLQSDLQRLVEWSTMWQMPFNDTKCSVMHLGGSNQKFDYFMGSYKLEAVSQEKDLGFCITDNLKPSMQYVYSKASRDLGLIGRTISFKSTEYTFWFDYTRLLFVPIWNTVCLLGHHIMLKTVNDLEQPIKNVKDRTLLQRVQHRFTRMVPGLKNVSYKKKTGTPGPMDIGGTNVRIC